jgi:hypothetical protein
VPWARRALAAGVESTAFVKLAEALLAMGDHEGAERAFREKADLVSRAPAVTSVFSLPHDELEARIRVCERWAKGKREEKAARASQATKDLAEI